MKLPDVTDVGTRLPNAVRGQPSYPTSNPAANALQGFGNTLASVGFNAAEKANNEADKTRALGVQSRFLQFEDEWSKASVDRAEMATPGAAGFTESLKKDYASAAKAFFKSVPAEDQPVYDQRLFDLESRLTNGASKFEREEKDRYAKGQIEDGQGVLLSRQAASPDNWQKVEQEGEQLIRNRPGASPTEADDEVRKWRKRRAMALFETRKALDEGEKLKLGVATPSNSVVDKIIGVESGGNANAKNPTSSASGLGQFIDSTWLATVRKYRPDIASGKSANEILALKNDPVLGREMTKAYTQENAEYLTNRGVPLSAGNLYLAHFLGPGGAVRALKADPGASVASVMGQDVVNANKFLAGKSIAELQSWADKKMGGSGAVTGGADTSILTDPAPEYAALSYEDRLGMFEKSLADERNRRKELSVEAQGQIETTIANAPAAIQNTGSYDGEVPSLDKFVLAYGPDDGVKKFDAFNASMEVSQQAYDFRAMSTADINQAVQDAVPVSSGNDAALQADKFRVLQGAAEATIKARNADPSAYTQQVFPSVAQAWQQAGTTGDYQSAMSQTAAAQKQLGIASMRLLPGDVADQSVAKFKDENAPEQDRIGAVAGLVFSTADPEQRLAVFDQLVKAGLPEITAGAIRASARGDTGAAQRLFEAAMVDVSKLPGKNPDGAKPADIDGAIQSQLMDVNQIGDVYYGLSDGSAENMVAAQRDSKLMTNAVTLRVRKGESLDAAVTAVAKDLFGDVKPVSGANVSILIPSDQDENVVTTGLDAMQPQVRKTLEQTLTIPGEVKGVDSALMNATRANEINRLMLDGYWRNAGNGFAFLDPKTGLAVAGPDGNPLIFSEKEVLAAGGTAKANSGSVGQTLISPTNNYDARTPEPGAGPSLDENGNPVVLGQ